MDEFIACDGRANWNDLLIPEFWEIPMDNIEMTFKVNGEAVGIETISTETFEKAKKLAENKKVAPVRLAMADSHNDRLLLRVSRSLRRSIEAMKDDEFISICTKSGFSACRSKYPDCGYSGYTNVHAIRPA